MFGLAVAVTSAIAATPRAGCPSGFEVLNGYCAPTKNFAADTAFFERAKPSWLDIAKESPALQSELQEAIAAGTTYPADQYHGRGIVFVAGGQYLRDAMTSIAAIRGFGCRLRIQVWYKGDSELPHHSLGFFDKYGVETYNLADYVNNAAFKIISSNSGDRPFQLKPLAVKYTDLEEVLLLDADNIPTRDPTYLFDSLVYKETGTLFWPDYWTTHSDNPIWAVTGVDFTTEREQESGQMLINKQVAWSAVNIVITMQNPVFYSLLNGDKDTYRFAWKMTGTPYKINTHFPSAIGLTGEYGFCGHSMGQYDFDGKLLFVHHNNLKLSDGWKQGPFFSHIEEAPIDEQVLRGSVKPNLLTNAGEISCFGIEHVSVSEQSAREITALSSGLKAWEAMVFNAVAEIDSWAPIVVTERSRRQESNETNTTLVYVISITQTVVGTTCEGGATGVTSDEFATSTGLTADETFTYGDPPACVTSGSNAVITTDFLLNQLDLTAAEVNTFLTAIVTAELGGTGAIVTSALKPVQDIAGQFKIESCAKVAGDADSTGTTDGKAPKAPKATKAPKAAKEGKAPKQPKRNRRDETDAEGKVFTILSDGGAATGGVESTGGKGKGKSKGGKTNTHTAKTGKSKDGTHTAPGGKTKTPKTSSSKGKGKGTATGSTGITIFNPNGGNGGILCVPNVPLTGYTIGRLSAEAGKSAEVTSNKTSSGLVVAGMVGAIVGAVAFVRQRRQQSRQLYEEETTPLHTF